MSAEIDAIARADSELSLDTNAGGTSFRQKVLDIWWRTCSKTGLTKLIAAIAAGVGSYPIPLYDGTGKQVGTTTKDAEASWNKANFAGQRARLDALTQKVDALSANLPVAVNSAVNTAVKNALAGAPTGATIDPQTFAVAVVNEFYTRLTKGA
jgi:hypothetical protein